MDPALFLADLEAKPAALRAFADDVERANPWRDAEVRPPVVFLGMGSSRFAAATVARRLRARGLMTVVDYASAEPGGTELAATAIGISASGSTPETVEALARWRGRPTIALTNVPGSPIVAVADRAIPLAAGEETGGAACRTFQHTLASLLLLEASLGDPDADAMAVGTIRRTAEATEDLLERRPEWLPGVASVLAAGPATFTIAPAERRSSADQGALMFREGPRRTADACESGDWLHVDLYLTKPLDYRAILFAGSRFDGQIMDWVRERGSTLVAVGADVEGAVTRVRYRHDDDADVALLTEVLVAELVAATWWNEGRTW